MKVRFRLRLTHQTAPALARRLVERALGLWNLHHRVDDVLIVTTELVQNVVEHTDDGGELSLALRPGTVVIEISDTSPEMPQLRDPDPSAAGGRGLRMVQAIARCWGVRRRPEGKVIWVEVSTMEPAA
jgi:anti-sigma regulatory factor (Ser/Thr protein kinase)